MINKIRKVIITIIYIAVLGFPCYSIYRIYDKNLDNEAENAEYAEIKEELNKIKLLLQSNQSQDIVCGLYQLKNDDFFINIDFDFMKTSYEMLPIKLESIVDIKKDLDYIIISSKYTHFVSEHKQYKRFFNGEQYSLYSKLTLEENIIETNNESKILIQVLFFIMGLILTFLYGGVILQCFNLDISFIEHSIISLIIGVGIISISSFFIGLLNFPYNLYSLNAIPLFVSILIIVFLRKRNKLKLSFKQIEIFSYLTNSNIYKKIYLIISFVVLLGLWIYLFYYVISKTSLEYPGYGIWGYKAKLFFLNNHFPIEFFKDKNYASSHQSYPLCISLYLSYLSFWMSNFNEQILKIVPFLFGLLTPVYIFYYSLRNNRDIVKSCFYCIIMGSGMTLIFQSYQMYVDNILLISILIGVSLIVENLNYEKKRLKYYKLAFFILGIGTFVKNEGLLYFVYCAIFLFFIKLFCEKRKFFEQIYSFIQILILPFILFVLPWLSFRFYNDIHVRMFKFFNNTLFWSEDIPYLLQDINYHFLQEIFVNFYNTGGIWIIFFILIICYPKKMCVNRKFLFCILVTCAIIATYIITLLFTTMRLHQHLYATGRILLIPTMILLFCFNNLSQTNTKSKER